MHRPLKKIASLLLLLFVLSGAYGQTLSSEPAPALQARQSAHDFGKIPQGKPVYYTFEFVNKGNAPVKLENVHAACGCTTPEWSKAEIAPGARTFIKVGYNAAADGPFEKFISVQDNQNNTISLKISGTVWKGPDGAAPANAVVKFLKQQIQ